jgi:hypothetical protein
MRRRGCHRDRPTPAEAAPRAIHVIRRRHVFRSAPSYSGQPRMPRRLSDDSKRPRRRAPRYPARQAQADSGSLESRRAGAVGQAGGVRDRVGRGGGRRGAGPRSPARGLRGRPARRRARAGAGGMGGGGSSRSKRSSRSAASGKPARHSRAPRPARITAASTSKSFSCGRE